MITENLSTLKIHKLTKEQYEHELSAGNIDERALYLTPDEEIDLSLYATIEQLNDKTSIGLVTKKIYVSATSDSLETQINNIYTNMTNDTCEFVSVRKADGVTISIGEGSNWQFMISKTNANYGAIIAWQYSVNGRLYPLIKTRGLCAGTWGNWNTITPSGTVLTSENWGDFISVSSGGTTSVGMGREFTVSPNNSEYTATGTKSKFYIVTCALNDGNGTVYSLTIDYRSVSETDDRWRHFGIPNSTKTLFVQINSDNTVTFDLGTAGTITHVTGYY